MVQVDVVIRRCILDSSVSSFSQKPLALDSCCLIMEKPYSVSAALPAGASRSCRRSQRGLLSLNRDLHHRRRLWFKVREKNRILTGDELRM